MLQKHHIKIISALSLVLLICIVVMLQMYKEIDRLKNPDKFSQKILEETITKVGKLMSLPEGETPTMATVTDPEKLKNQPFFARSSVGDRVIIYEKSGKVILYNPTLNKIIEVSVVDMRTTPNPTSVEN